MHQTIHNEYACFLLESDTLANLEISACSPVSRCRLDGSRTVASYMSCLLPYSGSHAQRANDESPTSTRAALAHKLLVPALEAQTVAIYLVVSLFPSPRATENNLLLSSAFQMTLC